MTIIKDKYRGAFTHKKMTTAFMRYNWDGPLVFFDLVQGRAVSSVFTRDDAGVITGSTKIEEYPAFVSSQLSFYNNQVIAKLVVGKHTITTRHPVVGFGKRYLNNLMRRIATHLSLPHKSTVERDELLGILNNGNHTSDVGAGDVEYLRVYDLLPEHALGFVRRFIPRDRNQHEHVGRWYIDGLGDITIGNRYDSKFKVFKLSGLPAEL